MSDESFLETTSLLKSSATKLKSSQLEVFFERIEKRPKSPIQIHLSVTFSIFV